MAISSITCYITDKRDFLSNILVFMLPIPTILMKIEFIESVLPITSRNILSENDRYNNETIALGNRTIIEDVRSSSLEVNNAHLVKNVTLHFVYCSTLTIFV